MRWRQTIRFAGARYLDVSVHRGGAIARGACSIVGGVDAISFKGVSYLISSPCNMMAGPYNAIMIRAMRTAAMS